MVEEPTFRSAARNGGGFSHLPALSALRGGAGETKKSWGSRWQSEAPSVLCVSLKPAWRAGAGCPDALRPGPTACGAGRDAVAGGPPAVPPGAHAQWLTGHAAAVVGRWAGRLAARARRRRTESRRGARPSSAPGGGRLAERASGRCVSPRRCLPDSRPAVGMARGNQRELARQKNMKKTQEISKGKRKEDSLTTSQRKQRDSEIMQQKQKIANEKKSMQTREK
ncbi:small EDRK-rich factor 1 [Peromyscus eremicus]|nr:small EDRK-rich factor 1 [Peromyscus eremicus]